MAKTARSHNATTEDVPSWCWENDSVKRSEPQLVRPRWMWAAGGSRLLGSGGVEYRRVSTLERVEVERLLALGELDAVQVACGGGITEWVGPSEARRLWLGIERDFWDVEGWRPPPGARGMLQYEAQLWRSTDGHHVIVFVNS